MTDLAIQGFRGRLIGPSDKDYDEARALYNGMIDKRPRLIARCADVADVIAAVNFAREQRLLLAIRGGGHNGPGLGSCDDGLVIDLSPMNGVRVDPRARTVRVDPGCTLGRRRPRHPRLRPRGAVGIVASTGVAGLTLGGGTGYLTRKYGLTVDNLLEADVVLADGRFVTASKDEHPDLFWALAAAAATSAWSPASCSRPTRRRWCSPARSSGTPRTRKKVMRRTATSSARRPRSSGCSSGLKTVPPVDPFPKEHWGKRACALIGAFNGPAAEGQKLMARLLEELPAPLFNWMGEMPFPAINASSTRFSPRACSGTGRATSSRRCPTRRSMRTSPSAQAPSALRLMHLYPIDGAVRRVAKGRHCRGARATRRGRW